MKQISKKQLIHRAGEKLFGKFGVNRVSIDMIVKEAQVAKGTFYLYFENKQDLYEAIIEDIGDKGKKHMLYLSENIADIKDRFLKHMIGSLNFYRKNQIVKNLIDGNEDYCCGKITHDYLFQKHIEMMKILVGNEFSDEGFINLVSNVKGFFTRVINSKKHFNTTLEYEDFILNLAAIMVNGLFSDYKGLLNNRSYSDFMFDTNKLNLGCEHSKG